MKTKKLTITNVTKILKFLTIVANELQLDKQDILDFFNLNQERDPKKAQLKEFAVIWQTMPEQEQDDLRYNSDLAKNIDFNLLEQYCKDIQEKQERLNNVFERLFIFFSTLKDSPVYNDYIDLLSELSDKTKEELEGLDIFTLIDIFHTSLLQKLEEDSIKGFFFTQKIMTLLNKSNILKFINYVKSVIQTKF